MSLSNFNISIYGFNITAEDLDWSGEGANFFEYCGNDESFRRHGDLNLALDWTGICENADFGMPNPDIQISPVACPSERTAVEVIAEDNEPIINCPGDRTISVLPGKQYMIPDFKSETTVSVSCDPEPFITQVPEAGTLVGLGETTVTMKVPNAADCTFMITVNDDFYENIILYPNPTTGVVVINNRTAEKLVDVVITDARGRFINAIDLSQAGRETSISLANLAQGMYFITVNLENTSLVKRIVKH